MSSEEDNTGFDIPLSELPYHTNVRILGFDRFNIHHPFSTQGLLAPDHVILNHGQMKWTTPDLAPSSPNYHTTPFSGTGLELVTRQATIRYLYHSATAVMVVKWSRLCTRGRRDMRSFPGVTKDTPCRGANGRQICCGFKFSHWGNVEIQKGGGSSRIVFVSQPCFKISRSVASGPRVTLQCDVN
ncbi:hypothetical protein TNCV_4132341 [Trichonephila clavipes]|nr:hypothetical protein TNCV_4132341 [Trichonephila clavipes]